MKKKQPYTIYALSQNEKVYIGKTAGRRVSAVYSKHVCGERGATKGMFSSKNGKPTLHVLCQKDILPHEAYRLIVAYAHVLQNAGYTVLNDPRTMERAKNLHPETQVLVEMIRKETPDALLKRTAVAKPSDADVGKPKVEEKPKKVVADRKLTIRLPQAEKNRFDVFAASMNMTQREALQFLISKYGQTDMIFPEWERDAYVSVLLGTYKEENARLKKANEKLYAELTTSRADKKERTDKSKALFTQVKKSIAAYFQLCHSSCEVPLQLEWGNVKGCEMFDSYAYPNEEGIYVFRPQMILWGNGRYPACFILGVGDNQSLYKFRFYPRDTFVGVDFRNERFGLRGSTWIVACQKARDLSMDLKLALPLDVIARK